VRSWAVTCWQDECVAGIGALIELWKVTKVMNITIVRESGKLPRIQIKDRQSYIQTNTKTYDDEAMRYLSYVLFPCVVGYFIYSLVYHEYKSWCAPCCLTGMDQLTTAIH
jgi:Cleft lip and palate transmembrane protein 1 (CLPTM1)